MNLVLTVWMPARLMNRGDNNPTRQFMGQTSIPRVFVAGCQRQAKNENLSGARLKPPLETSLVQSGQFPLPELTSKLD